MLDRLNTIDYSTEKGGLPLPILQILSYTLALLGLAAIVIAHGSLLYMGIGIVLLALSLGSAKKVIFQ